MIRRTTLSLMLIGLFLAFCRTPSTRAQENLSAAPEAKIAPWLDARLRSVGWDSFIVLFDSSGSLRRVLRAGRASHPAPNVAYDLLRSRSRGMQAETRRWLEARSIPYKPLYIVNGLQVSGDLGLARALAARREVVRIVGDPKVRGIAWTETTPLFPDATTEWGILAIRADVVWNSDSARGEGIVVASADTGVEWNHPAIRNQYRGWNGLAASHDFNWHDAIQDLDTPIDDNNHGTHTTGTMVGDGGVGNTIGVAPGAHWIACRNMDHGDGQPSTYLDCNQFFLAPYAHGADPELDGDPSKAPDIVNNSWACPPSEGCDAIVLRDSFTSLQAAGILAVAAAGNSGSACSTVSDPPGIYDEALVAGATDISTTLASFSSRGPVTVDGSNRVRPDLAAPGVGVRSAIRGGLYASFNGTSMASPHAAGAAALLWSKRPQLRGLTRITSCLLTRGTASGVNLTSAQTCGGTSSTDRPNNMFGWGLLDAYGAIHFGPDTDSDGIADSCDCNAFDGGAYDSPSEVAGFGFEADRITLSWTSLAPDAGSGTIYDLIRGDLDDLRGAGDISGATCLIGGLPTPSHLDEEEPVVGSGFYYVVQGRNICGAGGWGEDSSGNLRVHPDCP